jgi:hypothetical protein
MNTLPEIMPELGIGQAAPWRFLAVPWKGPTSALSALLGFDIGICIETIHTAREAREEIMRLISDHDTGKSEVLCIQVGSPDHNGLTYPTDEVIMDLGMGLLSADVVPTTHLKRIVVHNWARGEVHDVGTSKG